MTVEVIGNMTDPALSGSSGTEDPLAKALQSLFVSFTGVVQGELQLSNNEYELLKNMNLRTASEYDNYGDFAAGLSSFVTALKQKNDRFDQHLQDMEVIDKQVTELEALVSTLDSYTSTLESQLKAAIAAAKKTKGAFLRHPWQGLRELTGRSKLMGPIVQLDRSFC